MGNLIFAGQKSYLPLPVFRIITFLGFLLIVACSCESGTKNIKEKPVDLLQVRAAFAIEPVMTVHSIGDSVQFNLRQLDSARFDSLIFKVDGDLFEKLLSNPSRNLSVKWYSVESKTGSH
ncbi:MAG TPA: hypothetical protein PKY12_00370, partial [Catalimonadaceae bacterium]|nr:hypothetical protein [Catalimonadaceae bacterium]